MWYTDHRKVVSVVCSSKGWGCDLLRRITGRVLPQLLQRMVLSVLFCEEDGIPEKRMVVTVVCRTKNGCNCGMLNRERLNITMVCWAANGYNCGMLNREWW